MNASAPVIHIAGLEKQFGGLRPLRLSDLSLAANQRAAISGIDGPSAEALVNLVTGATLPDAGSVTVFGQATSATVAADEWLAALDRFGLVSSRAVLVDDLSLAANLAMAFTLSIDPIPDDVLDQLRRLAGEVGLSSDRFNSRLGDLDPADRARCHLARALASAPRVLLLEHANVLAADHALAFGRLIAAVAKRRQLPLLALTADQAFARVVAVQVFTLDAATGRLLADFGWRRILRGVTP